MGTRRAQRVTGDSLANGHRRTVKKNSMARFSVQTETYVRFLSAATFLCGLVSIERVFELSAAVISQDECTCEVALKILELEHTNVPPVCLK